MDPLGKKGEQALEGVQNVSQRLEQLESHLTAVDSALQDFMSESRDLMEKEYDIEMEELKQISELADQIDDHHYTGARARKRSESSDVRELEDRIESLEKRHHKTKTKVDKIFDRELLGVVSRVTDTVRNLNKTSRNLKSDLKDLESRLEELENNFLLEENKRDYDFDQKLDKSEFEAEKVEMLDEIRKMRASVNILADEIDKKDKIELE